MKQYTITGGKPVTGTIKILGAKNFVTKAMVAALLGDSPSTLLNTPAIGDVTMTGEMIASTGCQVRYHDDNSITIDPASMHTHVVTLPESGSNRIPILMIGALLHRFGKAEVPALAGCNIGSRKVDFHVMALEKFGAVVEQTDTNFTASIGAEGLKGCKIDLPYPSVGATETCLFLGAIAEGKTVINNAAREPEIMEIITMLRAMGSIIFSDPNRKIIIEGQPKLRGTMIHSIGDRIDAASWACLAAASDGRIVVEGIVPKHLGNFMSYFQQIGGGVEILGMDSIAFYRQSDLKPGMIETDVYPGFSTDWQQPFAILLTQAEGISVIHETVYENRFGYLSALNTLGANTQLSTYCLGGAPCRFKDMNHKHSAIVTGATPFVSDDIVITVPDLRAGLAYVIAAAIAEGTTTLEGVEIIERGYGNLIERCENLDLDIRQVS
jgi:UDP-N-acetylglucosamine 1-carboxyvinyltransferase